MDNRSDDTFHYKVLVFKSSSPISISVTLNCDAKVTELKSHATDDNACIVQFNRTFVEQKAAAEALSAKDFWDILQTDGINLQRSRSSSTISSFSILNESLSSNANNVDEESTSSSSQDNSKNNSDEDIGSPVNETKLFKVTLNPVMPGADTRGFYKPESQLDSFICHVMEFTFGIITILKDNDCSQIESLTYICNHLENILNPEVFMELPLKFMKKITGLQRNDPIIEFYLAKNLIKWSERQDDRKVNLPVLLQDIDLRSLEIEQLIEISEMRAIRRSLKCRDIIDRVKNDLLTSIHGRTSLSNNLASSVSLSQNAAEFDSSKDANPSTISVLTCDNDESPEVDVNNDYFYFLHRTEACIKKFYLKSGESERIAEYPGSCDSEYFSAVSNTSDYLFTVQDNQINTFNLKSKVWTQRKLSGIQNKKGVVTSICILENCLYILFRRTASLPSENIFYKYEPSSVELQDIILPITAYEDDFIIPFNDCILFLESGELYDPVSGEWRPCNPGYPSREKWHFCDLLKYANRFIHCSMTVMNDEIVYYLIEKILCFQPQTGELRVYSRLATPLVSTLDQPRSLVKLLFINSTLYMIHLSESGLRVFNYVGKGWIGGSKIYDDVQFMDNIVNTYGSKLGTRELYF